MNSGTDHQPCDYIETCSFYWNYKDNADVQKRGIIEQYCHSDLACGACKRITWYMDHSGFPPPNISPEGDAVGPKGPIEKKRNHGTSHPQKSEEAQQMHMSH